uniref:Uncharacterized protein n=1 Tax=Oryza sativa subsp. japonica TaxID=39947 RepID=Q65XU1_ORYSJ|nr:unknown protein [Oryza sativa Japonica Group]
MQDVMEKSRRAHFLFDDDDQTPPKQNGPQNDDQHNNDDGSGCLCVSCYGGVAKPKAPKSSSPAKDVVAGGRPAAGSNCT